MTCNTVFELVDTNEGQVEACGQDPETLADTIELTA